MQSILLFISIIIYLILPIHSNQVNEPEILVGKNQLIDLGYPNHAFVECHLSINPNDPNHWLVGVIMVDPSKENDYWDVAVTSFDGGKSWKFYRFGVPEAADPWCIITESGEAAFSVLGYSNLYTYHSRDGGNTWNSDSIDLGEGHDHQVFVQDRTEGPFKNRLYITSIKRSNIYVAYSDDNGKTFTVGSAFKANSLNTNTLTPVILSDGTLLVSYVSFQRQGIEERHWLRSEQAWIVQSSDGGKTFSHPYFVTEVCGKGFDQLAVDHTNGPFKDRLYWLCASQKDKAIYFHYSPDKAKSWSESKLLREYVSSVPSGRPLFNSAAEIAINDEGVIGVLWQDRTDDPQEQCQYAYFTASLDGGTTFLPPVKVSDAPSCPERGKNGWAGTRWKAGGDYQGLVAKPDGSFQALWADSRSGVFQLYTADVKIIK